MKQFKLQTKPTSGDEHRLASVADEPLVVDGLHRHPVVVAGIEAVQGDLRLVGFEDVGGVVQVAHFQLVMHQVARRT